MTMAHPAQIKIPATYMRGGTSKGVFFRLQDLPAACQQPGNARDKLFLRVIGSPDPSAAHIDGMGSPRPSAASSRSAIRPCTARRTGEGTSR